MSNQAIIDNWSLYEIKNLLANGLSQKEIPVLSNSNNDYNIDYQSEMIIQINILLQFLNDLVTRDNFLIDPKKKNEWLGRFDSLDQLNKNGIITDIIDIGNTDDDENIQIIKSNFNISKKIENALELNRLMIDKNRVFYSNVINGSARYLNKSSKINAYYSPHPCRADFIAKAIFPHFNDANNHINEWIRSERLNVIEKLNSKSTIKIGLIPIDPIVIEIIENSSSPSDLISVALQMRSEYKRFRNYLNNYQDSINNGDLKKLLEYNRLLDEIHNKVINFKNPNRYGTFSISIGYGLLKYSNSSPIFDKLLMRVGVKATLQKLILKSGSKNTISKLLKMFDVVDIQKTNQLMEELK